MSHQAKLRIILQDHDIRKLDLPHGLPGTVGEHESIVRKTFGLQGNFTLHYKDADFGEKYFSLISTSDIKDKDTIKVVNIVEPYITLNVTEVDTSFESESETSIYSSATSVSTSDTLILSSPEHGIQRSQRWPAEFPVPRFAYDTELLLASGNEAFKKDGIPLNFTSILPDILERLAESVFQYVAYPTSAQFVDVDEALIQKHPCLKEPGSYNGYYGWQQRLKYKMASYRTKLRGLGYPELDVNSLRKKRPHEKAPAKNVKKPKKSEVNYLPPHPQGEMEESLEYERVELLSEVQKSNPDLQLMEELMTATFSQQRKEIIGDEPFISVVLDRWPAFFNERQVTMARKNLLLRGRNLKQNRTQGRQPSASTGWVKKERGGGEGGEGVENSERRT
uniref:Uncharacterized protein n=1 Tax=Lates calcarifer TaxID=8187 RepID=A0A4W6E0B6_LATCA